MVLRVKECNASAIGFALCRPTPRTVERPDCRLTSRARSYGTSEPSLCRPCHSARIQALIPIQTGVGTGSFRPSGVSDRVMRAFATGSNFENRGRCNDLPERADRRHGAIRASGVNYDIDETTWILGHQCQRLVHVFKSESTMLEDVVVDQTGICEGHHLFTLGC